MSERFTVRFAETDEEKKEVYALRYRDMLQDYRSDFENETGLDYTDYDAYAKAVICIDNDAGEIVGSYRIVTSDDLPTGEKFLCEDEFNIDGLKATGEKMAELSRAVVKKEYRNSAVLMLLLRFIAQYMRRENYRYLIGEASFYGVDKTQYIQEMSYLSAYYKVDEKYGIFANEKEQMELLPLEKLDVREVKRKIPALIRAYTGFGATVSADSYTDREFGSVDIFILLDMQNYNENYLNRLLRL